MRGDMASKESNLPVLYTELSKLGQNGEYERALKTANRSKPSYSYHSIVSISEGGDRRSETRTSNSPFRSLVPRL